MSNNLTFKLILDGDSKGLIAAAKQSELTLKSLFDIIKIEAEKLKTTSEDTSTKLAEVVPSEAKQKIDQLVEELNNATSALKQVGSDADLSADNLKLMGEYGENALKSLNEDLEKAKSNLNYLSSTNATPQDIANAQREVNDLEEGIKKAKTAFETYTNTASDLNEKLKVTGDEAGKTSKVIGDVVPKGSLEIAEALTSNLNNATLAIKGAGTNAGATAKNFTEFGQVSENVLAILKSDLDQAKQKLHALSTTNATPQDINKAQAEVDKLENEVDKAEKSFKDFKEASNQANQELKNVEATSDRTKIGFKDLKSAVGILAGGLAALGLGLTAREFIDTADATQQMAARLRKATDSTDEYNKVQGRLLELANATFRPLSEAQEVYLATSGTMKSLGYNTEEVLSATESLSLSFTHNATRADQAQSAQDALAKSMAKGSVDADAWMSIITGADNVVSDMAKSTGKSESEIRKLGASGKASLSDLVNALIQSRDHNLELANAMENSTADATQKVRNNLTALIGTMNEQHDISSRLAEKIGELGDNLDWIAVLFDDVMNAVDAVSSEFDTLDPSAINNIKEAISSAYEAVKELAEGGMDLAKVIWDVLSTSINNALSVLSSFTGEVSDAGEQVSFLTRIIQGVSVGFGFLQDGITATRITLNLLAGAFYSVASAANSVLSAITWGDVSKQFSVNADIMKDKAKAYYQEADKEAQNFNSQGLLRLNEAAKSQEEKNQDRIESAKATIEKINGLEVEAIAQQKLNIEKRNQLEAELASARSNNEVLEIRRISDELNELDKSDKAISKNRVQNDKEKLESAKIWAEGLIQANEGVLSEQIKNELAAKNFSISMSESGKITVSSLTDARKAVEENAKATELAKQKAIQAETDYQNFVSQNASKKIQLEQQIAQAKVSGDLTTLKSAQDSLAGINAKEEELNQERQKRSLNAKQNIDAESGATKRAYSEASEIAKQFEINLDAATGRISESFSSSGKDVDEFKKRLNSAGIEGTQAANAVYLAWQKWMEQAKSQVEIDVAKAKLIEFEKQGVFSASQVDQGMQALSRTIQKLPNDLNPVEQAFERLGIKTKEQLKLAAQSAIADFNTIQASGKATADQLKQAYERTMQAAAASGDRAVMAQTQAKAASLGLSVQIDDTGKATVQSFRDMDKAAQAHSSTVSNGVTGAYRRMGDVAREEAQSSIEAWNEALAAQQGGNHATTNGEKTRLAFDQSGVEAELKAMGYDEKRAAEIAKSILSGSKSGDGYKNASASWLAKNGLDVVGSFVGGGGGTSNANYVREQLERYSQYSGGKSTASLNTDSKTVKYEISTGKSSATVYGNQKTETDINSILSDLEAIKKSS